ncbi:hypothetical protein D9758_001540 [Tetrapyrgos nigripes]|uniref:Uncharacterized protein n=1 Tax=Tetrapyrgos nigripes TaxID=182062 RepID=A0A8H5GXC6_9AGAR|nr:hypothetical protein D9758_001540 [Tetrapyrgos nigripes]
MEGMGRRANVRGEEGINTRRCNFELHSPALGSHFFLHFSLQLPAIMKFSTTLVSLTFAAFASAAPAGAPADNKNFCPMMHSMRGNYAGGFNQGCVELVDNCLNTLKSTQSSDIWDVKHCVSAAFCDGTSNLLELAACQNSAQDNGSAPSLNFADVYAPIVGDCAWIPVSQGGSCPMTRQNFIDFVYGSFSDIGIEDSAYPDVSLVINNWWASLTQWTATGETVPYVNLNDWLHFSHSK